MSPAEPIDLKYPFVGNWLVLNSPANRVPSHGTSAFGSSYAIDFVPVNSVGRSAPFTLRSLTLPEPPENFPGFGRTILSPVIGIVVARLDTVPDHFAYRGLPSLGYVLGQKKRSSAGWAALAGNHVGIDIGTAVIFLCHLKQGSIRVPVGARVRPGDPIARCGNTGNSTEPHLHLQAISSLVVERAQAVPITFQGALPSNGEIVLA
ncbi:M23 family metallopeptidase [Jonesiaceae bacterium BS-20]|uniref:M23 family metallopeptidase n=1 Tax=Jonesiaceae bacterium BS-20 TaxID=3120821 RepID=A0AAU7DT70_9MICO